MTFVDVPLTARVRLTIHDYRCRNCGRLLFRGHVPDMPGLMIEIRCSRCSYMSLFPDHNQVKDKANEPIHD